MNIKKTIVFSTCIADYAELCAGGRALSDQCVAAVIGPRSDAESVAKHASKVIWMGEKAPDVIVESYTSALAKIVQEEAAELVLFSSNKRTRCIAGRLSAKLDAPIIPDTSMITVKEDGVYAERMVFGGTGVATVKVQEKLSIAMVTSGTFEPAADDINCSIEEHLAVAEEGGVKFLGVKKSEVEAVDLTKAKYIVSIGRGVEEESFVKEVEKFAQKVGAETACSRPVAEERHWMPISRYIGISGTKVKPDVYIACGISGQIQHMIGANDAKKIIAINKDENAPIFRQCDYGIIGNVTKVIPLLNELL